MYYNGLGVQPDNSRAIGLIAVAAKETGGGDSLLRPNWPPALDWIKRAQSNPAISSQIADALKRTPWPKRGVDSAKGGCDEQSLNTKIEE
jgi:hypothetical protein